MATGMTLGSPAVASGAATAGGWLDRFMAGREGARLPGRLHHRCTGTAATSRTGPAVQPARVATCRPIYDAVPPADLAHRVRPDQTSAAATPTFPTEAQQAAFLTAATKMLDGLPYVQRYAWFAPARLGTAAAPTGLFRTGSTATAVGRAYQAAR